MAKKAEQVSSTLMFSRDDGEVIRGASSQQRAESYCSGSGGNELNLVAYSKVRHRASMGEPRKPGTEALDGKQLQDDRAV